MTEVKAVRIVLESIQKTTGDDDLTIDTSISDLNLDSLDAVEVLMEIEKSSGLMIGDQVAFDLFEKANDYSIRDLGVCFYNYHNSQTDNK